MNSEPATELTVFMHYVRILVGVAMPTHDMLLCHFRKICYTSEDAQLRTLISYALLARYNGFMVLKWWWNDEREIEKQQTIL